MENLCLKKLKYAKNQGIEALTRQAFPRKGLITITYIPRTFLRVRDIDNLDSEDGSFIQGMIRSHDESMLLEERADLPLTPPIH